MIQLRKSIVIFLFLLAVIAVPVYATQQYEQVIPYTVNPNYADVLDPDSLELGLAVAPSVLTDPVYGTKEDAAALVTQYMHARCDTFDIYVQIDYVEEFDYEALFHEIFQLAIEHTGDPVGGDYLRMHYGGYGGKINALTDYTFIYITYTYNMFYYTTAEQEEELDTAVDALLEELDLYQTSSYNKVKGIYDYMTHHIDYDYDGLTDDSDMLEYSAYDALINKAAVCQGYSNLFYRLALELGVDCRIIAGSAYNGQETGRHAWNIVKLGDVYYNLDSTWDEPRADYGVEYDYFLLGSTNFTADHFADSDYTAETFTALYPICETDYDPTPLASGTCGEQLLWTLYPDGSLVISGDGPMNDFKYIGNYVSPWYDYRNDIEYISIEEGATSIGTYAFQKCANLKAISIADSVSSIGSNAFSGCTNLCFVKIPEGVETIFEYTFSDCTALQEIHIPESVVSIGSHAFGNCVSLNTVWMSKNIAEIGMGAFYECRSLSRLHLSDLNAWYDVKLADGQAHPLYRTGGVLYLNDAVVTELAVPETVEEIGNHLFIGCTSLTSVSFHESIKSIGISAFQNCTGITALYVPQSVQSIGDWAFRYCSSLQEAILPENAPELGKELFCGCTALVSVTLPENLKTITPSMFSSCTSLTEISLPDSVGIIDYNAFWGCTNLKRIHSNAKLKEIGDMAFKLCESLEAYSIPETVTRIGYEAFCNCDALTSIVIPDGITVIEKRTFAYCSALSSITIPATLQIIEQEAFMFCPFTVAKIPCSVTEIGADAFYYCSKLKFIEFLGNAPSIDGTRTFTFVRATVFYPEGDPTWDGIVGSNYGGTLTWVAINPPVRLYHQNTMIGSYRTFAEPAAIAAGNGDYVIRLTDDLEEQCSVEGDLWIDLNGHTLSGISVDGTVYGMDSSTDGYTDDDMGTLNLSAGNVASNVKTTAAQAGSVKRYLAIKDETGGYSFHRVYFALTHISLEPGSGGVGYQATFAFDDTVKRYLDPEQGFGLVLSLDTPVESLEDGICAGFKPSALQEGTAVLRKVLLRNLWQEGLSEEELTNRAGTILCARGYIQTADGEVILSASQEYTYQEMVESIDSRFDGYPHVKKIMLGAFYQAYEGIMKEWSLPNIRSFISALAA